MMAPVVALPRSSDGLLSAPSPSGLTARLKATFVHNVFVLATGVE